MSSSPIASLESCNRSAPKNDNGTWISGGIEDAKDSSVENGGSITRGGLCGLVSFGVCERGSGGDGRLRLGEWIRGRSGGAVSSGDRVMIAPSGSTGTSKPDSPEARRSGAEVYFDPGGWSPLQNSSWGRPRCWG